jgi:predicted MPP superfamily phosphohydrolase
VLQALAQLSNLLPGPLNVRNEIAKRTAGHDPTAWQELRHSIPQEIARESWPKDYLVVTGDFSTSGDDQSIDQSINLATAIAGDANIQNVALIYGNHDVWLGHPGGFPLGHPGPNLDLRRSRLHLTQFPGAWPKVTQIARLPNGGSVALVGANTIEHGRLVNALAMGKVDRDRYWEQAPGADQLPAIAAVCRQPLEVVVALTHHPVHDPRPWTLLRPVIPITPHALGNAASLAQALVGTAPRVVLSGHTHETVPDFGASTGSTPIPQHGPLGANQLQLTAGTASQMQFGPLSNRKPHVWQMIQLYATDTQLRVERIVFARWPGEDKFEAVASDDNDPDSIVDVWEFTL